MRPLRSEVPLRISAMIARAWAIGDRGPLNGAFSQAWKLGLSHTGHRAVGNEVARAMGVSTARRRASKGP